MLSNHIGKIIKEARLEKKLTQSEVVGDFITRNMLSQIESGAAYPSVKTLEYLANKLGIPIQNLMNSGFEDEIEEIPVEKQDSFIKAKNLFKAKKYLESSQILSEMTSQESVFYDEACAMLSKIYLDFAKKSKDISHAIQYAELAEEYSSKGIYAGREVATNAVILLDSLARKIKKQSVDI